MKKLFYISIFILTATGTAKSQTISTQPKSTIPKTVDKNVKKLEKKSSKAETLTEREQEEKKTEEQARPNPMKSKISEKALNPQPFPPADKNIKKDLSRKQKSKL